MTCWVGSSGTEHFLVSQWCVGGGESIIRSELSQLHSLYALLVYAFSRVPRFLSSSHELPVVFEHATVPLMLS